MTTKSDFTKAKRYTFFHTEHTTTFDGNETQHVKGNLTASVDGNQETKADIIIQNGPVAMRSTASIDGDIAVGGNVDGVDVAALQANVTDSNASISNLRANMINVNASVDALQTNIINANASINSINALNLIKSIKTTISYSQLTATSPAQAVPLFRASPGDTIIDQVANLTASFGESGVMKRTLVSVGDAGTVNGLGKQIALATPIGWQWTGNTTYVKGEYLFNASPFYREHKTYAAATLINAVFTASNMWLASLNHGSIDFYVDVMSRG